MRESLEQLSAAVSQDVTLAICEVQTVRRAFSAAINGLSARTDLLQVRAAALVRETPLLLPFDEPIEHGLRIRARWINLFWVVLVALCFAAIAGGYAAGRIWRR